MHEYEVLASDIVRFLKSEEKSKHHLLGLPGYDPGNGWTKRFTIEDVTNDASVFAAMATIGYFKHPEFPKWNFMVTEKFIRRCPVITV